MSEEINECKNCGHRFKGSNCNYCGQKSSVKRFTLHDLIHEFIHGFFHFDKGFFLTLKELFMHPHVMLSHYMEGKRVKYFNPFTYLVLISLIGGYVHHYAIGDHHLHDNFVNSEDVVHFTSQHFNIRLLVTLPIYAFFSYVIYRNKQYNFAEFLIIWTYVVAQSVIIMILFMTFIFFVPLTVVQFNIVIWSAMFSYSIYQIWTMVNLMDKQHWILGIAKAILLIIVVELFNALVLNEYFVLYKYIGSALFQ
jgi:hypothetical protein